MYDKAVFVCIAQCYHIFTKCSQFSYTLFFWAVRGLGKEAVGLKAVG